MVHEYAYLFMNTFGNRSISLAPCSKSQATWSWICSIEHKVVQTVQTTCL